MSDTRGAAIVRVERVTSMLEVAGVACLLVAAFALDWRLGVAVVGVALLVLATALSRPAAVAAEEGDP